MYAGAAFDGRYVYFALGYSAGASTVVPRYDTTAGFTSVSSWQVFDMAAVGASPNYFSAGFDGEYVYFLPQNSRVVRFDAKSPPSLPPGFRGSFF